MLDGFLKILGLERRDARLSTWSPELAAIFGAVPTSAGVSVTPSIALQSPVTLAACRAIFETCAQIPAHLYERAPDGSRERVTDHPAASVLGGPWSPWCGNFEGRAALGLDALLHGAGYAEVISAGSRREIHRLDPAATTIDWSGDEPFAKTTAKGIVRTIPWERLLIINTPGSIPGRQLCLTNLAREAIALDIALSNHQGRILANGARPSGLLKIGDGKLSPDRIKELRESWASIYAGGANSGKTAVLEAGWSFEELQFSSVDLQFMEQRRFVILEIARAFRVPPTLLADLERGTWNTEQLGTQFVTFGLLPWLQVWEEALSRVLIAPTERDRFFVEFQIADLLRADTVARFGALRQAVGGAWMTRNEARKVENLPPVDGGDELLLQAGQGGADDVPPPNPAKSLKAVA